MPTPPTPAGITFDAGKKTYTADYSEHYAGALKFARQMIWQVESANPLQWIDKGTIDNGVKVEDLMINLAKSYPWISEEQTGANVDAPNYPDMRIRIYEEWNGRQFWTTVKDDEIRKMLMQGENDIDVAAKIVSNITESEGSEDFKITKALLANAITNGNAVKYEDAPTEGVSVNGDLVLAIKNTVDAFGFVNSDYIAAQDNAGSPLYGRTPFERIHIVIPYKIYNKLDVDYLASIFNLTKTELRGKISTIDEGSNVHVLDEYAIGKITRLYRMTSRYVENGLFQNYWLTIDRMYYTTGLFKHAYIPVNMGAAPAQTAGK